MSDHQIKDRWVSGESARRLSAVLRLPSDPYMQDWEIMCADPNRIGEFLDLYETGELSEDDRFALMALIVSSLDDWLGAGETDAGLIQRLRAHLLAEFSLHEKTIHYWCLLDEPDPDNVFQATPFLREIWGQRR